MASLVASSAPSSSLKRERSLSSPLSDAPSLPTSKRRAVGFDLGDDGAVASDTGTDDDGDEDALESMPDLDAALDELINTFDGSVSPPASSSSSPSSSSSSLPLPLIEFKPTRLPVGVEVGSTCLAFHKTCFFPAKLLAFEPATTAKKQKMNGDKYMIMDQDQARRTVTRKHIIFLDEDRMGDCVTWTQLGRFELVKVDGRARGMQRALPAWPRTSDESRRRGPTPDLTPYEGAAGEAFGELDLYVQLALVRPVLLSVLLESYPPAQWRVDAFFRSSAARHALKNQVQYGDLSQDESAETVVPEIMRWALGDPDETVVGNGVVDGDGDGDGVEAARPGYGAAVVSGSERYKGLSQSGRVDYVHDVLVPEALVAMCIRSHEIRGESEQAVYDGARDKLDSLAEQDPVREWSIRRTDLNRSRERVRRRLCMPPERMDDEENKQWQLARHDAVIGWAGGRVRKKVFNEGR